MKSLAKVVHDISSIALPMGPLIAAIPVSLRKAGNAGMNNRVTAMLRNLATDISDPIRRLKAIMAPSADSKQRLEDVRDVIPTDVTTSKRLLENDL